jgi:hypothetical protein
VDLLRVDNAARRAIAARDVPPELLDGYLSATADADVVLLRLSPRSWRSVDLSRGQTATNGT